MGLFNPWIRYFKNIPKKLEAVQKLNSDMDSLMSVEESLDTLAGPTIVPPAVATKSATTATVIVLPVSSAISCEQDNQSSCDSSQTHQDILNSDMDISMSVEESLDTLAGPTIVPPAVATESATTATVIVLPVSSAISCELDNQSSCDASQTQQDADPNIVQAESANKRRIVDLTVADDRPTIYNVSPPHVTKPFAPWKLAGAFAGLPFVGAVKDKDELEKAQNAMIRDFIGNLSDAQFEILELYCSPENLLLGDELKIRRGKQCDMEFGSIDAMEISRARTVTAAAMKLRTCRRYKMRDGMDKKYNYARKFKYRGLRYMPLCKSPNFWPVSPDDALVPGKDLIFRIRLYRPFNYCPRGNTVWTLPSITRCPIFTQDLLLTGRHTLLNVRDSIPCNNETNLRVDISENPNKKFPFTCKTLFPSSFLFINNAFYNDQRQNCTDLSAPVIEWAKTNDIGEFSTFSMDTRLDQITVKLGYPEVYLHQGCCEHTFTFADVRLLTASDPLNINSYPTQTLVAKSQDAYCTTCAVKMATKLVANCERVPFDPAFMCDTCFDLYLYDKNGRKTCDFLAYNYAKE